MRARRVWRKQAVRLVQRVGNHPILAGLAGTAIAVAMTALMLVTLASGRVDAIAHSQETAANLTATLSTDLERNIEIYDLSLQAMVDGAQHESTWRLAPDVRRAVLFDRATTAAYLAGAYIVDNEGYVVESQSDEPLKPVSFADRDYFLAHQTNPHSGFFISHPYQSRLRDGKLSIAMSRRIAGPDNTFGGIALLAMRIEYFQRLLDRINPGRSGSVFIALDDGTLLARKPFNERDIGNSIGRSPTFGRMAKTPSGYYAARSAIDGVERMYTFTHVPGTPLIVAVAPAMSDVLQPWKRRSMIAGTLTLAFALVFVAISWSLAYALRGKVQAQAELMRLAATDSLTGLSNRRTLDTRLADEWRRARRSGNPLSVLFIDIDYFKRINDRHGHATGDEVLGAVADTIAANVRRSLDLVARYGGEEFAVILPETPIEGAIVVGEKIRRAVQTMNLLEIDGERQEVTVSVGCASKAAAAGGSALDLLAAADAALYAAKAAGRNNVKMAGESALAPEVHTQLS